MTTFCLPDLGEGLQEAEIVAWHVSAGDHVVADQLLVSVETDKAVVEIPAPQPGRVGRLYADPGDIIEVGAKLAEFDDAIRKDVGAVVGELPREPAKPGTTHKLPHKRSVDAPSSKKATPAVRALARSKGVALDTVRGSGPGGVITSKDVETASAGHAGELRPLRGARRSMAAAMSRSGAEVVPATIQDDANIRRWPDGADPMLRLIRAVAAGVAVEPGLNAWFDAVRQEIMVHQKIDLGIAVDTPDGLYAPVLRDAGGLAPEDGRTKLDVLTQAVRDRSIARDDLLGQTFTLSNFGMIAGRHVSLVVVPPQVAILGAGRMEERVVVVEGAMEICKILPVSLTFDHRVVTGGEAARFLAAVIADLETD
jgi:pyruvate dehydrogenase E2 component (dihydrolipoamide acetyltransferase)